MQVDSGRVLDGAALLGTVGWVASYWTGVLAAVEAVLAFVMLVLVPLVVGVVATPTRNGQQSLAYRVTVVLVPLAGLLAVTVVAVGFDAIGVALAVPWAAALASFALFGCWRALPRGLVPVEETVVDVGIVSTGVVGCLLATARMAPSVVDVESSVLVLAMLAALQVVCVGVGGRTLDPDAPGARAYRPLAGLLVLAPVIVVLAPTTALAASTATVATAITGGVLAGVSLSTVDRGRRTALGVASVASASTVVVATGVGRVLVHPPILVPATVATGAAVLAWRHRTPASRARDPGIPFSDLIAGRYVGADFLDRRDARDPDRTATGMVGDLSVFDRPKTADEAGFDADRIHPDLRRIYERTDDLGMEIAPEPSRWFRPIARAMQPASSRREQLDFPLFPDDESRLRSVVHAVDADVDGRAGARAWKWLYPSGDAMYVSVYATHSVGEQTYAVPAFPMLASNMSVVLRAENIDDDGLRLTASRRVGADDGLYLVTPLLPVRLPLSEHLELWPTDSLDDHPDVVPDLTETDADVPVVARHQITVFGRPLVTMGYHLWHRTPTAEDSDHSSALETDLEDEFDEETDRHRDEREHVNHL